MDIKLHKAKITSVEQLDDFDNEWVYDISIDDPTNQYFFGNNILLHNSTYFKTYAEDVTDDYTTQKKTAIMIGDRVGGLVNESFPDFMQQTFMCTDEFKDIMSTEREVIADNGIFVSKKRYVLHLVDLDGKSVDKLKVMGLDIKRTTLPKPIAAKISAWIERLLRGEEWDDIAPDVVEYKAMLKTTPDVFELLCLPGGVNNVEKYTEDWLIDSTCRLPGRVAASLVWNNCLLQYNDNLSLQIKTGSKIKLFYFKPHQGRFKTIGFPTDQETVPDWFTEHYIPNIDRHAMITRLIDKPLENIIVAIDRMSPTEQDLFLTEFMEFD